MLWNKSGLRSKKKYSLSLMYSSELVHNPDNRVFGIDNRVDNLVEKTVPPIFMLTISISIRITQFNSFFRL